LSQLVTAADYEAMSEDESRDIEIVDGVIAPTADRDRRHQNVVRRLANALDHAVPRGFQVVHRVDLRLRDEPLRNRVPDVVVFDDSVPDDEVLRPEHCMLVVEVMSPGSAAADQLAKPAEYAAAGIEHFWRIEGVERKIIVFRHQLDPTTHVYAQTGIDTETLTVDDPVQLSIKLAGLC
jgi:Uma2 family endonuclease